MNQPARHPGMPHGLIISLGGKGYDDLVPGSDLLFGLFWWKLGILREKLILNQLSRTDYLKVSLGWGEMYPPSNCSRTCSIVNHDGMDAMEEGKGSGENS